MGVYVGIDGGGTKTHAILWDTEAMASVSLLGGASRLSEVGLEASCRAIVSLIDAGLEKLSLKASDIVGISVCMSGIDLPEHSQKMVAELKPVYPGAALEAVNDALAVLTAGTHGEPGVVLIAGTGSIAIGEDADGRTARAGGYGSLFGDEGSGFAIGRQGLMVGIQSYEGRGPHTSLWDKAAQHFQVQHPGDLIPVVYDSEFPVAKVASFAPYVLEAAVEGDGAADEIVVESTRSYVGLIESVQRQLDAKVDKVVVAGGLVSSGGLMLQRLQSIVRGKEIHTLHCDPVIGAVLRAVRISGVRSLNALNVPTTSDSQDGFEAVVQFLTRTT